jgi:hypothetical protein
MSDLFGFAAPSVAFRDIRSTRPTVAEQKAELALALGRLINRVPRDVQSGSVNLTREWLSARTKAAALVKSSRASVNELTAAISNMQRFK